MDSRAADVVDEWHLRNLHADVFPFTIQSFWPAQPNALLVWLKQHEPQNYERVGAILMVKDYIKYRLTGEITGDYTDMSATSGCAQSMLFARTLDLYDLSSMHCRRSSRAVK
jgi:L-xylulokinase